MVFRHLSLLQQVKNHRIVEGFALHLYPFEKIFL